MPTYEIVLSDGAKFSAHASSAADAIQVALLKNEGKTVSRCSRPGFQYEVPPHKAYQPRKKPAPEETSPLFDEAEIKRESSLARAKAGK